MEFTIFSRAQGCGYICTNKKDIDNVINPESITINSKLIEPGQLTDLDNHFSKPVKYLGIKRSTEHKELIFELGQDSGCYYYQSVFKITENRIFELFAYKSGRDFNYINGQWK